MGEDFSTMAPWDASQYFQASKETFVDSTLGGPGLIVGADPMRVALLFGTTSNGIVNVSTNPQCQVGQGLGVSSSVPLILTHADVGALVQQAWYYPQMTSSKITVIEVRLKEWPRKAVSNVGQEGSAGA